MLRRLAVVAGLCAAVLPFGGSAAASCADDLTYNEHWANHPGYSDHWLNWVHVDDGAVVVEVNDLITDVTGWTSYYVFGGANSSVDFVDCVAG